MGQLLACRLVVRRIADIQRGRMGTPLVGGPIQAGHPDICNQTQQRRDHSLSEVADRNQAPTRHPGTDGVAERALREVVVGCECVAVR